MVTERRVEDRAMIALLTERMAKSEPLAKKRRS